MTNRKIRKKGKISIGLISDTHGLMRPEAVEALEGSDLIIHAGDVGNMRIIERLELIAPVIAVRGNMDFEDGVCKLPQNDIVTVNGTLIYVIHDINRMDLEPSASSVRVVIYGHSHRPVISEEEGVYYINPGSAGPRRFRLPVSIANIEINSGLIKPEIITLRVR